MDLSGAKQTLSVCVDLVAQCSKAYRRMIARQKVSQTVETDHLHEAARAQGLDLTGILQNLVFLVD